jgi:hypothetical protein
MIWANSRIVSCNTPSVEYTSSSSFIADEPLPSHWETESTEAVIMYKMGHLTTRIEVGLHGGLHLRSVTGSLSSLSALPIPAKVVASKVLHPYNSPNQSLQYLKVGVRFLKVLRGRNQIDLLTPLICTVPAPGGGGFDTLQL